MGGEWEGERGKKGLKRSDQGGEWSGRSSFFCPTLSHLPPSITLLFPPSLPQSSQDVLYFADICAGPGGFSEYVLWRKTWHAKGFGFTLKGLPLLSFSFTSFSLPPSLPPSVFP